MEGLNNGDTAWMAMSCALVLFMTPGLAFFYGGLVRDSNIVNTMMMSIISMGLTTITWLVFGFSWSFDEWGAGKGFTYVGFRHLDKVWPDTTMPGLTFAVFQMTFAIIAAAIISGAVVERIRFSAYAIFIVVWVLAVYVPLCHWIWGGGWIAEMGAKDFAGGTVVHISSGTSAFALASLLGERKHRAESFPSNLPFVILGGGILWLGWTGFNGGSAFAANGDCALAVATTYIAAAAAMITWITVERILDGAPTSVGAMSGAVAGLVNITPCAGFVEPLGALGVGAIGALCCIFAARGLKRLNLVDDSLDCFSLHGVGGFAGAILGGFFDSGDGLIYGNDGMLLAKNLAGAAFGVVYSAGVTAVIFFLMRLVMRMRVSEEQELEGVDLHCHSEVAYGKNENSGKPNAFGEHSQRFKPEEAPTLLTSAPAAAATEKPTATEVHPGDPSFKVMLHRRCTVTCTSISLVEGMEGLNNGDTAWMAMSCALVLFMTPGLAFFYGGLVRDSNIVNTMMMSIISMGLTTITWLVFGFSWSFDEWGAGKGFTYVGFRHLDKVWPDTTMPGLTFAVFQMTFAIIAAAIISGAVVERIRFSAYAIFIVVWVLAVYVPLCHWIWGGGWIAEMGAKDFAGGTVVHISSGTSAFALASLLGERKHRAESFPSNLPFVILGGGILWLGWTGFNGGSAFAANGDCALAVATTYIAAAAAMITWITVERILDGAPTSVGAMSGAVAGLVNITPCAGFVEPLGALGVGAIGALCCIFAARGLKRLNLVDDSLDCFSLHGVGGFAGAILGGFFDSGDGLIYGNDGMLLVKNLAGAAFGVVYSAGVTAVIFFLMRLVMRMRVSEEQELEGEAMFASVSLLARACRMLKLVGVDLHCHSEVAYGKNENSGKPNAFGEHSQRFKPEEAPTLLTSAPAAAATEKPTATEV
ncbi:unnamed protein product [Symbiodinium natans]|uniref:Ammonium transporter AmtB-like domain-containing protein n=1 Tax=Symbiodinium natans TaxID=878477 RepID=A0A812RH49_9DINO|nr:unnamed protein product [Symbiodinium natans]